MITRLWTTFLFITFTAGVNAAEYFVAKDGDDSALGTSSSPWQTIQTSIDKLVPGDILNIGDGIYNENLKPTVSGTDIGPITIRAVNPFKVTIDAGGVSQALNITEVSYLVFEGFKLSNAGERAVLQVNSRDNQPATGNTDTHHITLRKMSVKGSCLDKNCNGLLIGRSNDILLEDAWVYGAGRYTLSVYGSRNITLRRIVVRWDQWYGNSYKPNDPRNAMGIYNTHDSLFENIIMLDGGQRPEGTGGDKGTLLLAGGDNGTTSPFVNSSNNQFYGLTFFNNVGLAISLSARSQPHNNNYFENSVVMGNTIRGITINKRVTNTTFNKMTVVEHPSEGYANWSNETSGNVMTNSIIANNGNRAFRGELAESYNIVFNNAPNYPSGATPGIDSMEIDPELFYVFDNNTVPLNDNLGSDGKRRGAHLLYRYYNGVESEQSLWPWFYEDEIYQDFCDPMSLNEFARIDDNSAGWCDSGKSLTRYLWNAVGNEVCPSNICDVDPEPLSDDSDPDPVDVGTGSTPPATETSETNGGSVSWLLLAFLLMVMFYKWEHAQKY